MSSPGRRGQGFVSLAEFQAVLSSSTGLAMFRSLDLEVAEACEMFELLDDGDGCVSYEDSACGLRVPIRPATVRMGGPSHLQRVSGDVQCRGPCSRRAAVLGRGLAFRRLSAGVDSMFYRRQSHDAHGKCVCVCVAGFSSRSTTP